MSLSWLIPTSMLHLGAILLVLGLVLVFVDVPGKGVPWDKIGAGFAIAGGFGVGGAAAGWIGGMFAKISGSVITSGQSFTANAVGVGVVGAIVFGCLLWGYSRVRGKGLATKSKAKSVLVVGVLGVVGTLLAALPLPLYSHADSAVGWAGSAIIAAIQ